MLLALGAIAAPLAFATADREVAGRIAGQLFALEARIGLLIAVALILLLRRHRRSQSELTGAPLFSIDLMLPLAAVFCTVAGHFALQPLIEAARAGTGSFSFAALHAISVLFYGVKTLLVLALAWRLAGFR